MNRKKSKLNYGPSVNGIIILLKSALQKIRYNQFFVKSKIYFKKSFITILHWCMKKQFICNEKIFGKKNTVVQSWFVITQIGRQFLELVVSRK